MSTITLVLLIVVATLATFLFLFSKKLNAFSARIRYLEDQHSEYEKDCERAWEKFKKDYNDYKERCDNIDLIFNTYFKDVIDKAHNKDEIKNYLLNEMELVYKRSTIGDKGDDRESYTAQELLDAQTVGILRNQLRWFLPDIDAVANSFYEKYQSSREMP